MTLDELMDFAKFITEDADIHDYCGRGCCSPEQNPNKVEAETARWWRERGKGSEG